MIPELAFVVQVTALGAAIGAAIAVRSFRRTGNPDRRWEVTTRWTTAGLVVGVSAILIVWLASL
jgi:hypothetical protein